MGPFQPEELLAHLQAHGVRYILIGGLAAVLQGSPLPTLDVDICPARERENLERLAGALRQLDARLRVARSEVGVAFPCDATFLGNVQVLNLVTRFGDLDLSFVPSGTKGYDDLVARAVQIPIRHLKVAVAAVEDIIRSKEAANRPKDQRALPLLRQLLDEIRRRGSGGTS